MGIVLAVMAVSAMLVAPAISRMGQGKPPGIGEDVVKLLSDARKIAIERNETVTLRLDPSSGRYRADTVGVAGSGELGEGTMALGAQETLVTDLPRLVYVFHPDGIGVRRHGARARRGRRRRSCRWTRGTGWPMPSRARHGVSLFEAVAALAIVGVTAVSALSAVGGEMRTADRARRALEVEALATSRLDFLALMSDQQLQNLPDSVAKGTFDKPLDVYTMGHDGDTARDAGRHLRRARWRVDWKGGSYALQSYIYRRPPLATRGRGQ